MWRVALILSVVACQTGCTAQSLRRRTTAQTETWIDIQYRQVMENLAMVANNPDVLPCFSTLDFGTSDVSDTLGVSGANFIPPLATAATGFIDPNLKRTVKQNWTLTQVSGPEKLRALHLAFLYGVYGDPNLLTVHDHGVTLTNFCYPKGGERCVGDRPPACQCDPIPPQNDPGAPGYYFNVSGNLARIMPGWLGRGTCHQVPKGARFKASCGGAYVWVTDRNLAALSEFTLVVQQIELLSIVVF